MISALAWAAKAFDIDLCLSSPLVVSQRSVWNSVASRPPRRSAKMATAGMMETMERLVFEAPSLVLKCWAGAHAALGHGVLRWSDLQHSRDLELTPDAVFGKTWRMKGKTSQVPWAAHRIGRTQRDWGKKWLDEQSAASLPHSDFVMFAPTGDWSGFKDRIADFYDAQASLRALLVRGGMTLDDAMQFSCHSWRHLFPTAGKQLDLTDGNIEAMARWTPGSGMPSLYDSRACVSELRQKTKVREALQKGWSVVDPGCLPLSVSAPAARSKRPRRQGKVKEHAETFVLQSRTSRAHGWREGEYTMCRQWKCGTPPTPQPMPSLCPLRFLSLFPSSFVDLANKRI